MDTFSAIQGRRSVKHYDADHKLSKSEIEKLLNLTLLAPTSFNIQHWRLIRITDPQLRAQIRGLAWDQQQVTEASELIIFCGDVGAWDKQPQRYWQNAPAESQSVIINMLGDFYRGREFLQRDEAIRSCAIAAQTLMLAAHAMGYGSCPMIGFDFDKVAELIRLPDDHVAAMMVTIGKPLQPGSPRGGQLPLDEVVFENSFS